jgi:AraC family transcriptional regulator, L-rhamnose operon regulatory protein RhaS
MNQLLRTVQLPPGWTDDAGVLKPLYTISQQRVKLAADRPVRIQDFPTRGDVKPHDHAYYEICIVRNGSAMHHTEAYQQRVHAGTIVIVPPGKVHAFTETEDFVLTNVYYLAEWLLSDLRSMWDSEGLVPLFLSASLFRRPEELQVPQIDLSGVEFSPCSEELDDTAAELNRQNPSIIFIRASFLKFMILVSRAYIARQSHEVGFSFRREVWRAMESIEQCITDCRPLNVAELAAALHLSANHLRLVFKQATGWSPLAYFQRRRIHHACQLLLNPRNSISEIGYSLGYADTAHLSRFFTRFVGMSPRAYRKRYDATSSHEAAARR